MRQRLDADARRERRDDDLVEAQREREQRSGEQRRAHQRERDVAVRLEAGRRRGRRTPPRGSVTAAAGARPTLLKTITTQNVACATTSVISESSMPTSRERRKLSAMPVTIPGRAIGRTTSRRTDVPAEEPEARERGQPASVPSTQRDRRRPRAQSRPSSSSASRAGRACGDRRSHHSRVHARRRPREAVAVLQAQPITYSSGDVEEGQHQAGEDPERRPRAVRERYSQRLSSAPVRRTDSR